MPWLGVDLDRLPLAQGGGGGAGARLDLGVRHGATPGGEILADADDDVVENCAHAGAQWLDCGSAWLTRACGAGCGSALPIALVVQPWCPSFVGLSGWAGRG